MFFFSSGHPGGYDGRPVAPYPFPTGICGTISQVYYIHLKNSFNLDLGTGHKYLNIFQALLTSIKNHAHWGLFLWFCFQVGFLHLCKELLAPGPVWWTTQSSGTTTLGEKKRGKRKEKGTGRGNGAMRETTVPPLWLITGERWCQPTHLLHRCTLFFSLKVWNCH